MLERIKRYFPLTLKGMAMGAADVVPGVSGGTIAFISGIYAELLDSIRSIDHIAVKKTVQGRICFLLEAYQWLVPAVFVYRNRHQHSVIVQTNFIPAP
jgi:uncharacterized membrane protein